MWCGWGIFRSPHCALRCQSRLTVSLSGARRARSVSRETLLPKISLSLYNKYIQRLCSRQPRQSRKKLRTPCQALNSAGAKAVVSRYDPWSSEIRKRCSHYSAFSSVWIYPLLSGSSALAWASDEVQRAFSGDEGTLFLQLEVLRLLGWSPRTMIRCQSPGEHGARWMIGPYREARIERGRGLRAVSLRGGWLEGDAWYVERRVKREAWSGGILFFA